MSAPGTARWADSLRRLFGLKHGESVSVLSDVMPVVNLLEEAPELRFYRGERRWVAYVQAPAGGAGTFAAATLWAPLAAERLTVVERVMVSKATSGLVTAHVEAAGLIVNQLAGVALDARATVTGTAAGLTCAVNWGATTPAIKAGSSRIDAWNALAGVGTWSPFFPPAILAPGGAALSVQNTAANETADVWFLGYDVPLHGGEED